MINKENITLNTEKIADDQGGSNNLYLEVKLSSAYSRLRDERNLHKNKLSFIPIKDWTEDTYSIDGKANVLLNNVLEELIDFLFNKNNDVTIDYDHRLTIVQELCSILDTHMHLGPLVEEVQEYLVVCGESNNLESFIADGGLHISIYLKVKTVNPHFYLITFATEHYFRRNLNKH